MITSKPISTIHYVESKLLKVKLDDLVMKNKINFYSFVKHFKEEDEKKDHIHLFIIPNGRIDTDQLRNELEFLNSEDISKPFRCLPFDSSKWADWFLYCSHDKAYLLSKKQAREFHYNQDEFISSDDQFFSELIHKIDFSKFKTQSLVIEMASNKVPFDDIVAQGLIPAQQFSGYKGIYESVFNRAIRLERTHDNYDEDTGEINSKEPW